MDISEIKDLINAISNSKIDIFDYEENGAKLHLEKKTEVEVIASPKTVAQDVLVKQEKYRRKYRTERSFNRQCN